MKTSYTVFEWKPEYAGPPYLFSLAHKAHAVAENLGTEDHTLVFFCNSITAATYSQTTH